MSMPTEELRRKLGVNDPNKCFDITTILRSPTNRIFGIDVFIQLLAPTTYVKEWSIDTLVSKAFQKARMADVVLSKYGIIKTLAIDTLIKVFVTKYASCQADTILKIIGKPSPFAVDADLRTTFSKSFDIDTRLEIMQIKTGDIDVAIRGYLTETTAVDLLLSYPFGWRLFGIDTFLRQVIEKTIAIDTDLTTVFFSTCDVDTCMQKTMPKTTAADIIVKIEGVQTGAFIDVMIGVIPELRMTTEEEESDLKLTTEEGVADLAVKGEEI